jgi:hypothetical protein
MTGAESHEPGHSTERLQAPKIRSLSAAIGIIILGAVWGMSRGGKIVDVFDGVFHHGQASCEWPDLAARESSVVSDITSEAMEEPSRDSDIEMFNAVYKAYYGRSNASVSVLRVQASKHSGLVDVYGRYHGEHGSCLLLSLDEEELVVSADPGHLILECRQKGAPFSRMESLVHCL